MDNETDLNNNETTKDVSIANIEQLKDTEQKISKDGAEKFHVLADFDRTLTTAFVDGKNVPSLISILRDGNYLTPDYAPKAHELFDKYHPIEIDPKIPFEEKLKFMKNWWQDHYDLLMKCGLNKKDIEKAVESGKVKLREGFDRFVRILKENNIPLVIVSSSGLGGDAISMYLEKADALYDNVFIISNNFKWDENGNMIGAKEPIVVTLNKGEILVKDFPFFEKIKDRKNVLLMGDSIEDVGMVDGFEYDNLIKIGFLNDKIEESLKDYNRNFDATILNDSSLDFVNEMLIKMFKK